MRRVLLYSWRSYSSKAMLHLLTKKSVRHYETWKFAIILGCFFSEDNSIWICETHYALDNLCYFISCRNSNLNSYCRLSRHRKRKKKIAAHVGYICFMTGTNRMRSWRGRQAEQPPKRQQKPTFWQSWLVCFTNFCPDLLFNLWVALGMERNLPELSLNSMCEMLGLQNLLPCRASVCIQVVMQLRSSLEKVRRLHRKLRGYFQVTLCLSSTTAAQVKNRCKRKSTFVLYFPRWLVLGLKMLFKSSTLIIAHNNPFIIHVVSFDNLNKPILFINIMVAREHAKSKSTQKHVKHKKKLKTVKRLKFLVQSTEWSYCYRVDLCWRTT